MSESPDTLARIEQLEKRLAALESGPRYDIDQVRYFILLPSHAVVGAEYAAWRFNCSVKTVHNGGAGTHLIKWESKSPYRALKKDIDRAAEIHTAPKPTLKERAARMCAKATKRPPRGKAKTAHA